jgi:hypothetical protein
MSNMLFSGNIYAKYTNIKTQSQVNTNSCDNGANCGITSPQTQGDGSAIASTNLQISKFNERQEVQVEDFRVFPGFPLPVRNCHDNTISISCAVGDFPPLANNQIDCPMRPEIQRNFGVCNFIPNPLQLLCNHPTPGVPPQTILCSVDDISHLNCEQCFRTYLTEEQIRTFMSIAHISTLQQLCLSEDQINLNFLREALHRSGANDSVVYAVIDCLYNSFPH